MYLVFGGQQVYPAGGAYDFLAEFSHFQDAQTFAEDAIGQYGVVAVSGWSDDGEDDEYINMEWAQVFDTECNEIVFRSGVEPLGSGSGVIELRKNLSVRNDPAKD